MGIEGISRSKVSRLAAELDERVAEFRNRSLKFGPYRHLWNDVLTQRVRKGGRVVNVSAVIATSVDAEGKREVVGFDVVTTDDTGAWTAFLRGLVARRLSSGELVISDAQGGNREFVHRSVVAGLQRLPERPLAQAGSRPARVGSDSRRELATTCNRAYRA